MRKSLAWEFCTPRFRVALYIEPDHGYTYDGDDPDGETQAKIDDGEYVAFDSTVVVELDGVEIASDSLCGSVYDADDVASFWTAHRDPDPMGRNCSIMRAWHKTETGHETAICHYFTDMVRTAIAEARQCLANVPHLRAA